MLRFSRALRSSGATARMSSSTSYFYCSLAIYECKEQESAKMNPLKEGGEYKDLPIWASCRMTGSSRFNS